MDTMKKIPLPHLLAFAAGLVVIGWIAAGYAGTQPLALAITVLIAGLYAAGALELYRYRQATASLAAGVAGLSAPPASLPAWIDTLHPSLHSAVRLRVDGARVALPAPALAPSLVGMLVLLGMLGTLLGMVLTLRGTGMALQTATDLQAIRDSLAAPVSGLGVAFGTSIAGVAASAMLGLLLALCRRERVAVAHTLDAHIATTLRPQSRAQRRDDAFDALQRQAEAMPALVERLDAMAATLERQAQAAQAEQAAQQAQFHAQTQATWQQLAQTTAQAIQDAAAGSARAAAQALTPLVHDTLAGLRQDTAQLHSQVASAAEQQLSTLASGFTRTTDDVARIWIEALDAQRQAHAQLNEALTTTLTGLGEQLDTRTGHLLDAVSTRLAADADHGRQAWDAALARQDAANAALAERNEAALTRAATGFAEQATALLHGVDAAHTGLQARLAEQDTQRLAAWQATLQATGAQMEQGWQQIVADTAARQQAICQTLASTADDIATQTRTHAGETIAQIGTLVEAAAQAPRAAAQVMAELRQALSDSLARDTGMLEERTQLMGTLGTLLEAVNHASTQQRAAIDALVSTSADLLERVGGRFAAHIADETGKLDGAADRLHLGAAEVASLGDTFAMAVAQFGHASDQLTERLAGIETALDANAARNDEQLGYYVAQAREVVDLSLLAQQQILEELQRLPAPEPAP